MFMMPDISQKNAHYTENILDEVYKILTTYVGRESDGLSAGYPIKKAPA